MLYAQRGIAALLWVDVFFPVELVNQSRKEQSDLIMRTALDTAPTGGSCADLLGPTTPRHGAEVALKVSVNPET